VLDVDDKNGKRGSDTLADLEAEYGKLPETVTVLTPSGGKHLYFTTIVEVRNDSGQLGEGLDIRGVGGYVVAPPSTHDNGGVYTFEHGYGIGDITPADAPDWMMHRLTFKPKIDRARPNEPDNLLNDQNLPSNRYNARTDWPSLLTKDGWTYSHHKNGTDYWTRPGKPRGTSASVNNEGNDALIVFSTNANVPKGGYTRFGYYAETQHGGNWKKASDAFLQNNPIPINQTDQELESKLIVWKKFWEGDFTTEDWIAYPLIARGRQTALYAVSKEGKSYVALACVAALASGKPIFGREPISKVHVLYLDYEMTAADLMERLDTLGYDEDTDLSHLHYALIPSIDPLNTFEGAAAVRKLVELTKAQVVVIDTTGRAVAGEENSADTYREFARTTGSTLKAMGVALLRTDHAGKDKGKNQGQRGSSAKNDDVDIVYRLERKEGLVTLYRDFSRVSWAPAEVELIEDLMDEDVRPLRLKEQPWQPSHADLDLAKQILKAFPNLKPGMKQKQSAEWRTEARRRGLKAGNAKFSRALMAIHKNKLKDPLETEKNGNMAGNT